MITLITFDPRGPNDPFLGPKLGKSLNLASPRPSAVALSAYRNSTACSTSTARTLEKRIFALPLPFTIH